MSIRKDAGRSIAASCSTPPAGGYLQTDYYQAYHAHKACGGVIGLSCWTHALRNFEKAWTTTVGEPRRR
ncbi:MAG: transposase [Ignavibacteria bacterium]|nr:transposase [Ignavibacteria bacterium]